MSCQPVDYSKLYGSFYFLGVITAISEATVQRRRNDDDDETTTTKT